jgi:flagellar protein FliS
MYNVALQAYRRSQTETASPLKLVALLYEGMLQAVRRARQELEMGNYEATHNSLVRAQRIVEELDCALDVEQGGEIAQNLRRLYDFLTQRLIQANLTKSPQNMAEVEAMILAMHQMWADMVGW